MSISLLQWASLKGVLSILDSSAVRAMPDTRYLFKYLMNERQDEYLSHMDVTHEKVNLAPQTEHLLAKLIFAKFHAQSFNHFNWGNKEMRLKEEIVDL